MAVMMIIITVVVVVVCPRILPILSYTEKHLFIEEKKKGVCVWGGDVKKEIKYISSDVKIMRLLNALNKNSVNLKFIFIERKKKKKIALGNWLAGYDE